MSPRQNRYKLLLDEMLPSRGNFPELNNLHDLKHIAHDRNLSGAPDETVVALAKKEGRILISGNEKHMIGLCKMNGVPLICVTESMANEEIDSLIVSHLKKDKISILKLAKPSRRHN
jgi:predicted nuclease of predicted toxin-antitoxin system